MTGHDVVKQLRILRSTPGKQGTYARLADSSDDLLLSIAEAFQPGDSDRLQRIPCWRYHGRECDACSDDQICEMLVRLQAAAERLEG